MATLMSLGPGILIGHRPLPQTHCLGEDSKGCAVPFMNKQVESPLTSGPNAGALASSFLTSWKAFPWSCPQCRESLPDPAS